MVLVLMKGEEGLILLAVVLRAQEAMGSRPLQAPGALK
jgi:hypothetical protein